MGLGTRTSSARALRLTLTTRLPHVPACAGERPSTSTASGDWPQRINTSTPTGRSAVPRQVCRWGFASADILHVILIESSEVRSGPLHSLPSHTLQNAANVTLTAAHAATLADGVTGRCTGLCLTLAGCMIGSNRCLETD